MTVDRADSFLRLIRRSQRGRLKVYLGYAAGVGKTYRMLEEGHRLVDDGIDAAVGYVETHGRAETARLLQGLDVVSRRRQEYRGIEVEEMDVDAILARHPQVALIDELAHTNIPGSRNEKRYQDVQDILAAGIHVITTLNVQHLESLYDTVERATGVKVRERMPDTVLAEADQIVNVDLTTEDLRRRLQEGKVYTPERIETALASFFTPSNLEQLRELTLRELAAQLDLRRRAPEEETPAAPDQVMVCLSSRGPNSEMLLRYASRLAGRLNRNWYAVYVQTSSEAPTVIDAATQRGLSDTLTLAKQLGAMVFTYKGEDVVKTILQFAKEYRVGHIVIGRPGPQPWLRRLVRGGSVVDRLIREAEGKNVVVLDTQGKSGAHETPRPEIAMPEAPPAQPQSVPPLGDLITEPHIVVWDAPATKAQVLPRLLQAIMDDLGVCNYPDAIVALQKREQDGSTFFDEGAAFPHARLACLKRPIAALGITRQGVSDAATPRPIRLVFLTLSPEDDPRIQVQLLAHAARAAQDRHLVQALLDCRTAHEAAEVLQEESASGRNGRRD
jgi:two-component system sensor histidine kinase KdpD